MEQKKLRAIQLIQLDLLRELDRICSQHNLKYYLVGGTLLGAIRHQGFIPWDVDIDVAMPRNDYNKFQELCKTNLNPAYAILNHTNTHNFSRPHALINKKGTKLFSKYDKFNKRLANYGIFIDLFPLDNIPDSRFKRNLFKYRVFFWKKLHLHKISYSYTGSPLKLFLHQIIRFSLFPFSLDWINNRFEKVLILYSNTKTKRIGAVGTGRFPFETESMDASIFGKPIPHKFEEAFFNVPEQYDEWLKRIFGDYLKVPSKEQQDEQYSYFEEVVF